MNKPRMLEIPCYEELSKLAHDDPAAYEAWRSDVIADFIDHAPARVKSRLRGLQWQVDCLRQQAKTPLGSVVRLNDLMWHSFLDLNDRWHDLADLATERSGPRPLRPPATAEVRPSARIIEFPARGAAGLPAAKAGADADEGLPGGA